MITANYLKINSSSRKSNTGNAEGGGAGCGKEQEQNLCLLYFRPVALGIYYHLIPAGKTHAEFVTQTCTCM